MYVLVIDVKNVGKKRWENKKRLKTRFLL